MEASQLLDRILLHTTNGGAECEIYLVARDSKHRVSTGPLAPLLDQLATAKEQFSPDTSEIILEPRPLTTALSRSPSSWKSSIFKRSKSDKKKDSKSKKQSLDGGEAPAWFTKATAEKAFHLLSSLELLEQPTRLARDLHQVHEKAKAAQAYARASLETSQLTFEREFAKAMLVANCAGYHAEDMGPVKSFAEEFGAARLRAACEAFETECGLALSRLPPRAVEKITAPPESWPPNQIPVLEAATFNDSDETADRDTVVANTEGTAPAAAAGVDTPSTAEGKNLSNGGGEEKNGRAYGKRETVNNAGVQYVAEAGSEGQETVSRHAVNLDTRRDSEAEEKNSSKPGPKALGDKPDTSHKVQAEADANEATGDAEPDAAEGDGNAEQPLEKGEGAGLGGEKDPQVSEHRQGLTANGPAWLAEDQETGPAFRASEGLEAEIDVEGVEGSVKGGDQQHLAPGSALPVEDAEVPLRPLQNAGGGRQTPGAKSEGTAGGGLVADSAVREETTPPEDVASLPEIEPSDSPSSPVFRSRSPPPENPLSWSDEEQMKLARDSYGSQGFAALGIAPLHSLLSPGSADLGSGAALPESLIHSGVHERARAESSEVVAAEKHAEDAVEGVHLRALENFELLEEEEVQSRELPEAGTRDVDEGGGDLVTKTASEPLLEQVTKAASSPSMEQVTRPASDSLLQHRSDGVETKEARANLDARYAGAVDLPQAVEAAKLERGVVRQASTGQVDGINAPEVPRSTEGDVQEVTGGSPIPHAEEQAGCGVLGELAVSTPSSGAAEMSAPTEIDRLWQATKERLFASGDRIQWESKGPSQMEEEQEVASNASEAGSSNQSGRSGGGYDSGLEPSLGAAETEPESGGQAGNAVAAARLAGTPAAVDSTLRPSSGSADHATPADKVPEALAADTSGNKEAKLVPSAESSSTKVGGEIQGESNGPTVGPVLPKIPPPSDEQPEKKDKGQISEGCPVSDADGPSQEPPRLGSSADQASNDTNPHPLSEPEVEVSRQGGTQQNGDTVQEPVSLHLESHGPPGSAEASPAPSTNLLSKARSYDKPWLSHAVVHPRSPREGVPLSHGQGPSKDEGGAKDSERRVSGGGSRRDSMTSYKERRQAKMKEQEERIRGEHEAKLNALEDALEKRKTEMAERSRRSARLSATAADRRSGDAGTEGSAPRDSVDVATERARERLQKYHDDKAEPSPPAGSRVNQLLAKLGVMVGNTANGQSEETTLDGISRDGDSVVRGTSTESPLERSTEGRSPSTSQARGQPSPQRVTELADRRSGSVPRRRSGSGEADDRSAAQSGAAPLKSRTAEVLMNNAGADVFGRSISPGRGSIVRTPQAPQRGPSPSRPSPSTLANGRASPGRASLATTPKSAASPYPSPRGPLAGRASPKPGAWNKSTANPPATASPAGGLTRKGSTAAPVRGPTDARRRALSLSSIPGTSGAGSRSSPGIFGGAPRSSSVSTFGGAPRMSSPGTFGGASRVSSPGTFGGAPRVSSVGRSPRPSTAGIFGGAPRSSAPGTLAKAPQLSSPGSFGSTPRAVPATGAYRSSARPGSSINIPGAKRAAAPAAVKRKVELLPETSKSAGGESASQAGTRESSRGVFQAGRPSSRVTPPQAQTVANRPGWASGLRVTVADSKPRPTDRLGNRTALPPAPRMSERQRTLSDTTAAAPKRRSSFGASSRSLSLSTAPTGAASGSQGSRRVFGPAASSTPTQTVPPDAPPRRTRHSIAAIIQSPTPAAAPRKSAGGFGASTSTRAPLKPLADAGTVGPAPRISRGPSYTMSSKDRLLSQTKASQARLADRVSGATSEAAPARRRERSSISGPVPSASSTPVARPTRRASSVSVEGSRQGGVRSDAAEKSGQSVQPAAGRLEGASERQTFSSGEPVRDVRSVPPQRGNQILEQSAEGLREEDRGLEGREPDTRAERNLEREKRVERDPEETRRLERRVNSAEEMFGKEIHVDDEERGEAWKGDASSRAQAELRQQQLLALLQARQQAMDKQQRSQREECTHEHPGGRENGEHSRGYEAGSRIEAREVNSPVNGSRGGNLDEKVQPGATPAAKLRKRWEAPVEPLVMQRSPDKGGALTKLGKLFSRRSSKGADESGSPGK